MTFRDLTEFLVVKPIVLPIAGKDYSFPGEISARLWLQLQRLNAQAAAAMAGEDYDPGAEIIDDETESEISKELLGDALQEMLADGRTSSQIRAVFQTLHAWHTQGEDIAEAVWNGQGEAVTPNRAQRRARPARGSHATSKSRKATAVRPGPTSSPDGS